MLSRIMTFFLVLTLTIPAHSRVGTDNAFKAALDEVQYALTVEWDQKDQAFYSTQMKKLKATLWGLQQQGMTSSEMLTIVKTELKNEILAKEIDAAFLLIDINKMPVDQARDLIISTMKKSYNVGASWNGNADFIILGAVWILIIGVMVTLVANGSCQGGGAQELCFYPNASAGDYSFVTCETADPCTGEVYSSYSYNL